jgi:hypothetical protein
MNPLFRRWQGKKVGFPPFLAAQEPENFANSGTVVNFASRRRVRALAAG